MARQLRARRDPTWRCNNRRPLLKLDTETARLRVDEAQAALDAANADVRAAKQEAAGFPVRKENAAAAVKAAAARRQRLSVDADAGRVGGPGGDADPVLVGLIQEVGRIRGDVMAARPLFDRRHQEQERIARTIATLVFRVAVGCAAHHHLPDRDHEGYREPDRESVDRARIEEVWNLGPEEDQRADRDYQQDQLAELLGADMPHQPVSHRRCSRHRQVRPPPAWLRVTPRPPTPGLVP